MRCLVPGFILVRTDGFITVLARVNVPMCRLVQQ